jgi:FkbM family methyltransferase
MSFRSFLRSTLFSLTPATLASWLRRERYYRFVRDGAPTADAECCRSFLKPGDLVIDVGANVGSYTKVFSGCVGVEGSVHALEPVPETFGYLSYNMKKLGLKNVSLHNIAAAAKSGDLRMSIPRWQAGFSNIYEAQVNESGEVMVQGNRLDDLFAGMKPALIKIDVEGFEAEVIRGAETLLRSCHPALLIEVTSAEPESLLAELGYRRLEGWTGCDQFFAYGPGGDA